MINILSAACATLVFVTYARIPQKIGLDFKPFNCEVCFPFWLCLILEVKEWYLYGSDMWQIPFNCCMAVVLTLMIRSHIKPAGY